jgi:hypothetical protein
VIESREEEAIAIAAEALAAEGFVRVGERTWTGMLEPAIRASLELPLEFPYRLPLVMLDRRSLPRRIPHVDKSGKICLAPETGIQLVTDRPGDLAIDALKRARAIVKDGLSGANALDLQREFLAYWRERDATFLYCICSADGPSRAIIGAEVDMRNGASSSKAMVLADSHTQLREWLGRLGRSAAKQEAALFFHLDEPFDPPDFDDVITVDAILSLIRSRLTVGDRGFFERSLDRKLSVPLTVAISMPLPEARHRVVFGFRVPRTRLSDSGFRPGQVPLRAAIIRALREPIPALDIRRLDPAYLIERGGGQPDLMKTRIVIVGGGAVGGPVAMHLAAGGVGSLHLIDDEDLAAENVHRHPLGVSAIGAPKVVGLRQAIGARFPHVNVTIDHSKIEDVVKRDISALTRSDLVVVALGDPTIESWLNKKLHGLVRCMHAWVEPQGLGGHVLLAGARGSPGCFDCIVDLGDEAGIKASLAAAGQDFGVSLAGCAGTFTPYGELDAGRAAIEAARVAVAALQGGEPDALLVSWMENPATFEGRGFTLSPRGRNFSIGERRREMSFVNSACGVCSG